MSILYVGWDSGLTSGLLYIKLLISAIQLYKITHSLTIYNEVFRVPPSTSRASYHIAAVVVCQGEKRNHVYTVVLSSRTASVTLLGAIDSSLMVS